jgi:hypothetical protein
MNDKTDFVPTHKLNRAARRAAAAVRKRLEKRKGIPPELREEKIREAALRALARR